MGHPEIPLDSLGLLILIAWFLFVPALCGSTKNSLSFEIHCANGSSILRSGSFTAATISADDSPLVAGTTFFYLAFGMFQALAVIPLLVFPLEVFFLPAPWLWGLRHIGEKAIADAVLDAEERALI